MNGNVNMEKKVKFLRQNLSENNRKMAEYFNTLLNMKTTTWLPGVRRNEQTGNFYTRGTVRSGGGKKLSLADLNEIVNRVADERKVKRPPVPRTQVEGNFARFGRRASNEAPSGGPASGLGRSAVPKNIIAPSLERIRQEVLSTPSLDITHLTSISGGILETSAIEMAVQSARGNNSVHRFNRKNPDPSTQIFNFSKRTFIFKPRFSLQPLKQWAVPDPAGKVWRSSSLKELATQIHEQDAWPREVGKNVNIFANNTMNNNGMSNNSRGKGQWFVEPDVLDFIPASESGAVDVNGKPVPVINIYECKVTKGKKESDPAEAVQLIKAKLVLLLLWQKTHPGETVPEIRLYFLAWFFSVLSGDGDAVLDKIDFKPLDGTVSKNLNREMGEEYFHTHEPFTKITPLNPLTFSVIANVRSDIVDGVLKQTRLALLDKLSRYIHKYQKYMLAWVGQTANHRRGILLDWKKSVDNSPAARPPPQGNLRLLWKRQVANYLVQSRKNATRQVPNWQVASEKQLYTKYQTAIEKLRRYYGLKIMLGSQEYTQPLVHIHEHDRKISYEKFIEYLKRLVDAKNNPNVLQKANLGFFRMVLPQLTFTFNKTKVPPSILKKIMSDNTFNALLNKVNFKPNENRNAYVKSIANRNNFAAAYAEFLSKNIPAGNLRQKLVELAAANPAGTYNAKRRYVNAQLARSK
jgi:hypothetical protein